MYKILAALAVLVGTVSADYSKTFVKAYTNEDTPREILNLGDLFVVSYDYHFEWQYGAFYKNTRLDKYSEECQLGVNMIAEYNNHFFVDILDIFHFQLGFQFVPFDVTPFALAIQYTTPMALAFGEPFGLSVIGQHHLLIADFAVNYLKDIKLPTVSILDFILDSANNDIIPVWPDHFDFTNNNEYDEPYLSIDLGEKLFTLIGAAPAYGDAEYFNV